MAIPQYEGTFVQIEKLSPSVKHFVLELDKEIDFKAGQFVNLMIEHEGQHLMKPYSICSSPGSKKKLELCIKLVESGRFTPSLFQKKVGDKALIRGPFGLFTLDKASKEKLVFIGTGTGITPFRSMIKDLLEKNSETEISLIFGCRYEGELLYKSEFEELAGKFPNFRFFPLVSRPTEEWNGRKGHVQDNFEVIDITQSEVYICGLPIMVEEATKKLLELGMDKAQIHHEKFI